MSTRPNKYPSKDNTPPERAMLISILDPIMHCNPEELRNYVNVLSDPNPHPEDESWTIIYNTNLQIGTSLRRMMRIISLQCRYDGIESKNDQLLQLAERWWIEE